MKQRMRAFFVASLSAGLLSLVVQPAQAEVKAQVFQVKMQLSEANITQVSLDGLLQNTESLPVRGIQIKVNLLDPNNQPVRSFLLEPFEHLESGDSERFSATYLLRDYEPLYLKATAEVAYTPTSYLQIADWFLTQNWRNLEIWRIPVSDDVKTQERDRIETALAYLEKVEPRREAYPDARRKWNLIQYTYGKRLAESEDGHEAILRLSNVEPETEHYSEALKLIETQRQATIFKRAMQKAVDGNLRGAYRQMLYIPNSGTYAKEATAKRDAWLKELKDSKVWLGKIDPPAGLSKDERNVWLRRNHGPEGYTTSSGKSGKKLRTWWYLDYSHYTFDEQGRLINQKAY